MTRPRCTKRRPPPSKGWRARLAPAAGPLVRRWKGCRSIRPRRLPAHGRWCTASPRCCSTGGWRTFFTAARGDPRRAAFLTPCCVRLRRDRRRLDAAVWNLGSQAGRRSRYCAEKPGPQRRLQANAGESNQSYGGASRLYVRPTLLLQFHHAHDARLYDFRLRIIGMSLFSALRMFSWVLPQALKEISGVLSAISSIRAFTGDVSSRSMCRPGPKVRPRSHFLAEVLVILRDVRCIVECEIYRRGFVGIHLQDEVVQLLVGDGSLPRRRLLRRRRRRRCGGLRSCWLLAGSAADDDARTSIAATPIAAATAFSNLLITHLP